MSCINCMNLTGPNWNEMKNKTYLNKDLFLLSKLKRNNQKIPAAVQKVYMKTITQVWARGSLCQMVGQAQSTAKAHYKCKQLRRNS